MFSIPATDDQLLQVMLACDEFREHWGKYRAMPFQPRFDGGGDDIGALDYLEYEGLDFPRGGDEAAVLVWGNVLARQVGLEWVSSYRGDLLLARSDPDSPQLGVAIWPFARFLEAQVGGGPQFGFFARLTRRVVAACREQSRDPEFDARLLRLGREMGED